MSCSLNPIIEGVPSSALEAALKKHKDNVLKGKGDSKNSFSLVEGFLTKEEWSNVIAELENSDTPNIGKAIANSGKKKRDYLSNEINQWIEEKRGISADKVIEDSDIQHESIGKYKHIIRSSAQDIEGLAYAFFGKGLRGEEQQALFDKEIMDPYWDGTSAAEIDRVNSKDYVGSLLKSEKDVTNRLNKPIGFRKYSVQQSIRTYNFVKSDQITELERQGTRREDIVGMIKAVEADPNLLRFADKISNVFGDNNYTKVPTAWSRGSFNRDIKDHINKVRKKEYLSKFIANSNAMFSPNNLAKIEAAYGKNRRRAIEEKVKKMQGVYTTQKNSLSEEVAQEFVDFVNNSVTTTLFFNRRSALLQSTSVINYLNWEFNNPAAAAKARLNHTQYKADKKLIMEGHFIKHRKEYNEIDVGLNEIREVIDGDVDGESTWRWMKKKRAELGTKGLVLTKMMDAWAISAGGAIHYRNRINDLLKDTKNPTKEEIKAAEDQAMFETIKLAKKTQQSSDDALTSSEQKSPLGQVILAYANTPMQYTRLGTKAVEDLVNGRGDAKTNITKATYYLGAAGIMFNYIIGSSNWLLGKILGESDDDDEEKMADDLIKEEIKNLEKISSTMTNTYRGFGLYGAYMSTIQSFGLEGYLQLIGKKKVSPQALILSALSISPPIQSKVRKAFKSYNYVIADRNYKPTLLDKPRYFSPEVHAITAALDAGDVPIFNKIVTIGEEVNQMATHNLDMSEKVFKTLGASDYELDIDFKFNWDDLDSLDFNAVDKLENLYEKRLDKYYERKEKRIEEKEKYYK